MKYIISVLFALYTCAAYSDTLPPALVKSKTLDGAGNPIASSGGALNVNIIGGGGGGTVDQGAPNLGGINAWWVQGSLNRLWNLSSGSDSVSAAVSNFPATQAVTQSGPWSVGRTWTLNSGTDSVTIAGSISASNPSVSATGAAVPAQATMVGGSDGTNLRAIKTSSTGVVSVDGSAVTQPVSGNLGRSWTLSSGSDSVSASVSNFPATQAVTQSGAWTVQQGTPPWSQNLTQLAGAAPSATNYLPSRITNGAAYVDPTQIRALTSSDSVTAVQTSGTNLHVNVDNFPATQPVSGTVTANQGGAPWSVSQSGNWSVRAQDGSGNSLTSQVSGGQRALDVGINVAGVQVDPRTRTWNLSSGSDSVAAVQSGTWNINNISGTISLPTGAATSANQSSQITQETTTATNTTSMLANQTNGTQKTQVTVLPADLAPATQNITAQDVASSSTTQANGQPVVTGTPTANSAATFAVASVESVEVEVTGVWTGTLVSEMSYNGTTWFTRGVKQAGSAYITSSFTQNFEGGGNITGTTFYRIRSTAAWTGTATVKVIFSNNATTMTVSTPVTFKDSTTQSITNTIKAASTASVAADTALVVALSPNSSTPSTTDKTGSGSLTNTGQTVGGVSNGMSTCNFTIAGSWSGVLFFSGVVNGGAAVSLPAYTVNGAPVSLTFFPTTNNTYAVNCAGFDHVFVQFFSFVSGTATVTYNFGTGVNYVNVLAPSTATAGSAVPSRSQLIAGSDGTNARNISTDATGVVQTSLGNTSGKVNKFSTGNVVTTATTSGQTVVTYTVTALKTFYLQYFDVSVILTGSNAATSTLFGTASLLINGATVWTQQMKGGGAWSQYPVMFTEPVPVAAGQVVTIQVTPAAVTSYTWQGNFGGYEK